jgi:hypothetical protein
MSRKRRPGMSNQLKMADIQSILSLQGAVAPVAWKIGNFRVSGRRNSRDFRGPILEIASNCVKYKDLGAENARKSLLPARLHPRYISVTGSNLGSCLLGRLGGASRYILSRNGLWHEHSFVNIFFLPLEVGTTFRALASWASMSDATRE